MDSSPAYDIRYQSWRTLKKDCSQQLEMGGFLLRTQEELPQHSSVTLNFSLPSGDVFEFRGQIIQKLPGHGLAVQFGTEATALVQAIKTLIIKHASENEKALDSEQPQIAPTQKRKGGPLGQKLSTDPAELRRQLEKMTTNEKRQAALSGRREARLLLIRDKTKAVHTFVLKNPGITMDEIESISKMPSLNPDALRFLASNRDWTRSITVCRNLVRNPKTPIREALMLLEKLPPSDVRAIVKAGSVRMPILQAARKKIHQG